MKLAAGAIALTLTTLAVPALAHDTGARSGSREGGYGQQQRPEDRWSAAEIRDVQQKLNEAGYPVGHADGVLGPKTHTAIRNFQRDKSLNATGDPTPETLSALRSEGGRSTSGMPAR